MLSNAYFLAKFRFDTAENEPAKNLQNFARILMNFANNSFANFARKVLRLFGAPDRRVFDDPDGADVRRSAENDRHC